MAFTTFRGMKPVQQLLFSAFIIITCFLVVMLLSVLIALPVFNMESLLSIPTMNDLADPGNVRILKYFQVAQSIGLFIIPPLIIAWLLSGHISGFLSLDRTPDVSSIFLVILLTLIISPSINFLGEINSKMSFPVWLSGLEDWMKNAEDNAKKLTEAFLKADTTGILLFNLFMIAFLPAIGEELLFRGVIQKIFASWTKSGHWGIWISAFLFSSLHLQFYGFLPRLILGVLFGYLLLWSGSLWLPVVAHFINNSAAVIAWFLIDRKLLTPEIEDFGATPDSFYMALISFALGILILWLIRRQERRDPVIP